MNLEAILLSMGYQRCQDNTRNPPLPFFYRKVAGIEHLVYFLPDNQYRVVLRMHNWQQDAIGSDYAAIQSCLNTKARQYVETLRLTMETFTT